MLETFINPLGKLLELVKNFDIEHPTFVEGQLVIFAVPDTGTGPEIKVRSSRLDEDSTCGMMRNSKGKGLGVSDGRPVGNRIDRIASVFGVDHDISLPMPTVARGYD